MKDDFSGYDGMEAAVLRRYISGQSEVVERQRVEAWAAETVARRRYLAAMRQLYEQGPVAAREETAAMWMRIAARMAPPSDRPVDPPYIAPWEAPAVRVDVRRRTPRVLGGAFTPRRRWRALLTAAAALMITVGGALLLRVNLPAASSIPTIGMRQIVTGKGQRAELQLSDGSRVVLGVDSRLRFPEKFGTGSRDLYLDGTAYFDAVHDAAHPFLVHTANAVAEDIGTRFIVTAYSKSRSTQVIVSQGAVALGAQSPTGTRIVLVEGQLGQLAPSDSVPSVRRVNPASYGAWMHGELVLRDMPLSEVAVEFGRWYAGELRLGDSSLASVPLTASFTAESFREAVSVVTAVAPVRAVWQGRTVTLYRR